LLSTLVDSHLKEAPFKELCDDSLAVGAVPRIEHNDPVCIESLDLTHISCLLLPTTVSHLHALHESLGDVSDYNPSFGPYCEYLEDILRKLM